MFANFWKQFFKVNIGKEKSMFNITQDVTCWKTW